MDEIVKQNLGQSRTFASLSNKEVKAVLFVPDWDDKFGDLKVFFQIFRLLIKFTSLNYLILKKFKPEISNLISNLVVFLNKACREKLKPIQKKSMLKVNKY